MDRQSIPSFCSRQQRIVRENTCPNLFNSGFILERNMHFVVANIVRPLTQSKGVSFVSLWGGRQVDYFVSLGMLLAKLFLNCFLPTFVHLLPKPLQASPAFWGRSHSWGTSFPHFVCSIQCHALSKEGPTSWIDAAYWICSFATWRRTLAHFHGVICVWRLYNGTACWNPIIPWRLAFALPFPLPLVVGWPPCTKCVFGPQVVKKIGVAPPDCVEKWCLLGSMFSNSHFVESHVFQIGEVEKHFVGSLGFKETEGFSL